MHNHGAVFAVFGFMYREFSSAVVAELIADALAEYIVQTIAKHSIGVPIAPDTVRFVFAFWAYYPKTFTSHFAASAVWVKTATFDEVGCAIVLFVKFP